MMIFILFAIIKERNSELVENKKKNREKKAVFIDFRKRRRIITWV